MQNEPLKPCPHCGGIARINYEYTPGEAARRVVVVCSICGAKGKALPVEDELIDAPTEQDNRSAQRLAAVIAWNLRVS